MCLQNKRWTRLRDFVHNPDFPSKIVLRDKLNNMKNASQSWEQLFFILRET